MDEINELTSIAINKPIYIEYENICSIMNIKEKDNHEALLHGDELYKALGFTSYRSFYNHRNELRISVPIFKIPKRKGWYARLKDVREYLGSF